MTATTTRATSRDLSASRKAYASRLEEATGYTIRWAYCPEEGDWVFYLVDPYGDVEGDPWPTWDDLVYDTEDTVNEYWKRAYLDHLVANSYSDADPGL